MVQVEYHRVLPNNADIVGLYEIKCIHMYVKRIHTYNIMNHDVIIVVS